MSKQSTAQREQWITERNVGAIKQRLTSLGPNASPSERSALEGALARVLAATDKDRHAEITAIAREANRIQEESGRRTRFIAWLALFVALAGVAVQLYVELSPSDAPMDVARSAGQLR
jgi:hypothetical protein